MEHLSAEIIEQLLGNDLAPLGPGPREGRKSIAELDRLLSNHGPKVKALVYLWHDHLDASHEISQNISDADGSFIHGIMHRREPDYSNAQYWFKRVGSHPVFALLAERTRLGAWDPMQFIGQCESISDTSSVHCKNLQGLQRLETELLLQYLLENE